MAKEPEVGKIIYQFVRIKDGGYEIIPVEIESVGRKYFYASLHGKSIPFNKETLKYENKEYSQYNIQLFETEQQIHNMIEQRSLLDQFIKIALNYNDRQQLTLDQLRKIMAVINHVE